MVGHRPQLKVAVVHDWLTGMRGGELCLEAILELFPGADVFTLIHVKGSVSQTIESHKVVSSPLNSIRHIEKWYRHFLPILPYFAESFNLRDYDLVISSSHCVAKGIRKSPNAVHLSYVYAPMRYMWNRFDEYFGKTKSSFVTRAVASLVRPFLQSWDRASSSVERVDALCGISHFIASEIEAYYQRPAQVIFPFVELDRFTKKGLSKTRDSFYLMVGAFAPYKRVDLAIEVFNRLGLQLKIVGAGQDENRLKAMAGPSVEFLGYQTNEQIVEWYSRCRGFVFPGLEDFGITPLEAMASGAPVIAFKAGGVCDTIPSDCGFVFDEQTASSLETAVLACEKDPTRFSEAQLREASARFTKQRFQSVFSHWVKTEWVSKGKSEHLLADVMIESV